jgi:hypothetical protein
MVLAIAKSAETKLNGALRRALEWWVRLLSLPQHDLTRVIPASPPTPTPPALSYTDASTEWGLGGVLYLPHRRTAYFFRTPLVCHDLIDSLEVEAAAIGDALFGPLLVEFGVADEISFVDNNVSLPWITSGCSFRPEVDAILAGMWLNVATRKAFKWWERVSSASNPADAPSRGLVPPRPHEWRLFEMCPVPRWSPSKDGQGHGRPLPPLVEYR